jgi:hypothetical protein
MTDTAVALIVVAGISIIPTTLSAVFSYIANRNTRYTADKMTILEVNTNSKFDALIKLTKAASYAQGTTDQKNKEKAKDSI